MSGGRSRSVSELEQRIAIVRENIRQLVEQAAAFSGAEDEDRNADRISPNRRAGKPDQATRCAATKIAIQHTPVAGSAISLLRSAR